uniref:hypothetical protein n=1 Tax=Haloprofundus sp. MHR1 TaxID=2572921 RepID=UPI001F4691F7|nr:hypothetical protein [Haloprofundus sp. MHR1]
MTLDDILQEFYGKALDLEERGRYAEAAEYYSLRAFAGLLKAEFCDGRSMRLAFAHTLEAISADVRAGNKKRPTQLFTILSPLYEKMIGSTDDPILQGLLNEWVGDAWLMLGSSQALDRYERAKRAYESQTEPGRNWAFEEEFDYAYWAVEAFLEATGEALDSEEWEFEERIQFKLTLADDLAK